jgi:hypothetical protein
LLTERKILHDQAPPRAEGRQQRADERFQNREHDGDSPTDRCSVSPQNRTVPWGTLTDGRFRSFAPPIGSYPVSRQHRLFLDDERFAPILGFSRIAKANRQPFPTAPSQVRSSKTARVPSGILVTFTSTGSADAERRGPDLSPEQAHSTPILRGNPDRSCIEASDKSAHLAAERDNYQSPVCRVSVDRDGVHVEVVMHEYLGRSAV